MLAYVIKSAICLSALYVPYMLLLRKESFFTFNRVMLIGIMLLSLTLPLADIHSLAIAGGGVAAMLHPHVEAGLPVAVGTAGAPAGTPPATDWWAVAQLIYLAGAAVTLAVKLTQVALLATRMHRGVLWRDKKGGVTTLCHAHDTPPYSWFGTIVISSRDYEEHATEILLHEMGHISRHHSCDIVLLNIVQTVQWLNPLAWLLGNSLRDVHEYEADHMVLRSGVKASDYQLLLIRKAVENSSYNFANGFNHSLLTKRIKMMLRKESNPWLRAKALYAVAVAGIALSAFATPELGNQVSGTAAGAAMPQQPSAAAPSTATPATQPVAVTAGAVTETANDALEQKSEKKSIYIVDGKQVTAEFLNTLDPDNIASMEVKKDAESLAPYGGDADALMIITTKNDSPTQALDMAEVMPQYKGGNGMLMTYLGNNVNYPDEARNAGIYGMAIVSFVVETDGSISQVRVEKFNKKADAAIQKRLLDELGGNKSELAAINRRAEESIKAAAVQAVSGMPDWEPGMQDGKPTRVQFQLPLSFKLDDESASQQVIKIRGAKK